MENERLQEMVKVAQGHLVRHTMERYRARVHTQTLRDGVLVEARLEAFPPPDRVRAWNLRSFPQAYLDEEGHLSARWRILVPKGLRRGGDKEALHSYLVGAFTLFFLGLHRMATFILEGWEGRELFHPLGEKGGIDA